MSGMENDSWITRDVEDLFHRADALWQVIYIQVLEEEVTETSWLTLVESMQDYKELRVGMEQDGFEFTLELLQALVEFFRQAKKYIECTDLQNDNDTCHRNTLEQIKNLLE